MTILAALDSKSSPEMIPTTEDPWSDLITHDGLFAVDNRQRITQWSPSAERILGVKTEDAIGKNCYEVIGGRDNRNYRFCRKNCPVLLNARRGRPTPDYDIVSAGPSGENKWINVTVAVPMRARWPFQVIHLFRDVTSRRRTEEFAVRAGAALRELFAQEETPQAPAGDPEPTPLPQLSRREKEVLRLLASGLTTKEIAETLGVQPITARNHVTRLLDRLGVESRLQAVVFASQHGLL